MKSLNRGQSLESGNIQATGSRCRNKHSVISRRSAAMLTTICVWTQSAGAAELQAVVDAGRTLSAAVLSSQQERQALLAGVARQLSSPVKPSRLPRAPRDWSPYHKRSPAGADSSETVGSSALPRWQSKSPLKLQMPARHSPPALDRDAGAGGSGDYLLAAEHGSPVARPAPVG